MIDAQATRPPGAPAGTWAPVCRFDELTAERGVAALVGETQVAVVRTFDGALFGIANTDPFTGANVLSRGIVGTRGDIPTIASPLLKQVFDLRNGSCLDDPAIAVAIYPVRVVNGMVEISCE